MGAKKLKKLRKKALKAADKATRAAARAERAADRMRAGAPSERGDHELILAGRPGAQFTTKPRGGE